MAGIEELVEIFRGENVKLNPFRKRGSSIRNKKNLWKAGKFITDTADEAASYARKIPSIIKSAKVPKSTWTAATALFDKTHFVQPRPGDSRYYYGLLNHADKNKLKVNILKTIGVNLKNLSPLAVQGLNVLTSLPVATIAMVLKSTPANADEATMKLEDFAKLAEEAQPKEEKKEKEMMAAGGNVPSTDIKDYYRRSWGIGDRQPQKRLKAAGPLLLAPAVLPVVGAALGLTGTGLILQQKVQNYFDNNPDALPKVKEWVSKFIPTIHGGEELEKIETKETFPIQETESWIESYPDAEPEKVEAPDNIPPQIKVEPKGFPDLSEELNKATIYTADRIPVEGEPGIAQVGKRFEVRISRGGKKFEKRFDTLEQAIAFRDEIAQTPTKTGKHMTGRSGELNPKFGKYKAEGGAQNIREILTDFIAQGKTTYTTQDVLDLVDKNLLKDEGAVEQTLQKIKKENPFKDLEFVSDTGGPIEFSAEVKQLVLDNYRTLTNEHMAEIIFPDVNKLTAKGRIKRILTDLEAEGKITKMKPGEFPKEVSDTFDITPQNIQRQKLQKERVDKLIELGSKTYEDELFRFKQKVQNALGLKKIQTKGKQKIDPIDTGHRSDISHLKALGEKIISADVGADYFEINRSGELKHPKGVKTLEGILKRDFYPDQLEVFKKAKKFLDEGKTIPVEIRKEIVKINDRILEAVDNANLEGRINALTLDPFTLEVKRNENAARTVGFGLTKTEFANVEIGGEEDAVNKMNYAIQILAEAVSEGLIDEKEGQAKLDEFFNTRIIKKKGGPVLFALGGLSGVDQYILNRYK